MCKIIKIFTWQMRLIWWHDDHLSTIWWYDHHIVVEDHHMIIWRAEMAEGVHSVFFSWLGVSPDYQGWHKMWAGRRASHHQAPLHLSVRDTLVCSPTLAAGPVLLCKSSFWQYCTPPLFWRRALLLSPSYSARVALVDICVLISELVLCRVGGACNLSYKPVWEDFCIFSSAVLLPLFCTSVQPDVGVYGRLQAEAGAEPVGT